MAVQALDIGPGDEVIMPSFTIISPAAAVVRQGAKPILIDSCLDTWQMDPKQIEAKIGPQTKAMIMVHIYGYPVDVDPILEIATRHRLKVIEDAAEMHGQTYKGRPCGSFGDISTFSFYPNKHITTGEGGMCLTNSSELAERLQSLRNLCFLPERRFVHHEIGWNYRLTNLQAALGVAQIERFPEIVARKREIGRRYDEFFLPDNPHWSVLPASVPYSDNIYWVYGLLLKDSFPHDAQWFMQKLAERKIGTRPFFYPMHLQPVFRSKGWYLEEHYPVSERLAERGFYVPSGLGITSEEQAMVVKAVQEVLALV
jgi:perosamine synthetase